MKGEQQQLELFQQDNYDAIEAVSRLMKAFGLDRNDDNFANTPERVVDMYAELLDGMRNTNNRLAELFSTSFPSTYRGIVSQFGIEAVGVCPHHLVTVRFSVDVGYIPNQDGLVVGLSKLARAVKLLAARAVMQEQLTVDIVETLNEHIEPAGVIAVVRGSHSCMQVRGVKDSSNTVTSSVSGLFESDPKTKTEFLSLQP